MHSKTISIFLADGEPDGLRTAEITNWIGKAISIPRIKLNDKKLSDEYEKEMSVYFLIGRDSEDPLEYTVYVGESESFLSRISTHDNRDENSSWEVAVVFISKDKNLDKGKVRYLEFLCHNELKKAKRCILNNDQKPQGNSLKNESAIEEMKEFFSNLKILLSSLGYPILEEIITDTERENKENIFKLKEASGVIKNNEFVVLKDSIFNVNKNVNSAFEKSVAKKIDELEENNYIEKIEEGKYKFIKDYPFRSPSGAAKLISGSRGNGWIKWKNEEGETLSSVYRIK